MIPDRPLREEIFSHDQGWKEVREVRERYEVDVEGWDRCWTCLDRRGPGGRGGQGSREHEQRLREALALG